MPHTNETAQAIQEMVQFFLPHCSDQSTLRLLDGLACDDKLWCNAHALFGQIRDKMLRADASDDRLLQEQYSFEEICAKTLFNMSGHHDPDCKEFPAPFDADSPFWVLPAAVAFARTLGFDDPCCVSSLLGASGGLRALP